MIIGSYAIGAHEGYVYVRAEYPLAVKRLTKADRRRRGARLPRRRHASAPAGSFHLHLKLGAGAFVCGEETALIASIEGKRGMPRTRPPYPAVSGLWGKPTNINNVETFANVPWIIANGAEAYAALGVETQPRHQGLQPGRQGRQRRPRRGADGLHAAPRHLRHRRRHQGRHASSRPCSSAGPPAAACPASLLDTPVDYESLAATGAIVGSGGMVVVDDETCMVDLARFFLDFTQKESCGKCVPCRLGTKRMLETLDRIMAGDGREGDIELLEELSPLHHRRHALRARRHGAQPGAHHHQVLPRRVRGARPREALPGRQVQGAHHLLHRPRGLHRLHAVRQEVPHERASPARRSSRTSSTSPAASSATPVARSASSTRSRCGRASSSPPAPAQEA